MLTAPDETPAKKGDKFQSRSIAIIVTVTVHLLLALFAFVRSVVPARELKPEITAEVLAEENQRQKTIKKEEIQKQVEQTLAQAPPMTKVLRTHSLAMTAVPEMKDLLKGPMGLGEGDLGVGFGASQNTRMGRGAMFFGQRVTGRMGVVFDVSGSMHDFVPIVIEEINRSFRQATVVCCNPASLVPLRGEPTAMRYKDADRSSCNLPSTFSEAGRNMHQELLGLPNCWFLLREYSNLGGGIEYLMKDGATSIFVFSDFQDTIIPDYLDEVVDKANRKKIKINLHVLEKARYEKQALMELCGKTGGRFAEGVLLKRARR